MRPDDICLYLAPDDRVRLQALVADRNTPRKLVWRAEIVLATADGHGTNEIMRRANTSKPTVWRWQGRYLDEGLDGLKRDKTRPSRVPPLPREMRLKVITKTVQETPANTVHWSRASMAEAVGISGGRNLWLPAAAQRQAEAFHMDQNRREYPHPGATRAGQTRRNPRKQVASVRL